jgi:ribonuclease M5
MAKQNTNNLVQIKETIVVEGKDDLSAIKHAVNAQVIITHGFCISKNTFKQIKWANEKTGVIIFTDPDTAGELIRKRINKKISGCKNAFLSKDEARKKDNIGIENAKPYDIIDALKKSKCLETKSTTLFSIEDLRVNRLMGTPDAVKRRQNLGKLLRIGYANAKQLVNRLNHYNISRQEFDKAILKL